MDGHIHIPFLLSSIAIICFIWLTTLPQSLCQQHANKYSACSQPYNCAGLTNISYPFSGGKRPRYCGSSDELHLTCNDEGYTFVQIGSQFYKALSIDQDAYSIKMMRMGLTYDHCDPYLTNNTLSPPLFRYTQNVYNITIFYDCLAGVRIDGHNFSCAGEGNQYGFYVTDTQLQQYPLLEKCRNRIQMQALRDFPLDPSGGIVPLYAALFGGFEVNYTIEVADAQYCKSCLESNGTCGTDETIKDQFSCHCPDGSDALDCYHHQRGQWNWKGKLVIFIGAVTMGLLICIISCCSRCKPSTLQGKFWFTKRNNQDIEAFLKSHGDLALKRYKFSDVKKMTNSFKVKLGQGGFGAVYKGKLLNGCLVAVKILNATKETGEEFVNEVASISRTSHVNVVTLLGFCFEGRKKVLIYEFMPNGSLEKFIYKKEPETTPPLSWEKLYQVAIGIARGLEYLHRGCNTRILHFDIKPHNILLDENFCPKISDFGLAKLCPKKESIISMSDARGTIGYVAPEVWNRHFGGVSHKSDVYSYGMMLLEMVGGRKNINAEASHSSEIYFPHWVYKKLELGNSLGPNGEITLEENEMAKRMTVVGLWCIQPIPNDRPIMSRVIEMLEGSINSLEMPPKPVLSSPTRSIAESFSTST